MNDYSEIKSHLDMCIQRPGNTTQCVVVSHYSVAHEAERPST